jgi:aromatic-amino-acid transaminase
VNIMLVAPHARGKRLNDAIFGVAAAARARSAEVGADNVINASIGQIFDEDGKFWALPTPVQVLRSLNDEQLCRYAPLTGTPALARHVLERIPVPDGLHGRVIATPGGAGALHLILYNYSNFGDAILAGLPCWGPYGTIATEIGRRLTTHPFFTSTGTFHVETFVSGMADLLKAQGRAIGIINSPAQNPSGYSLADHEWARVASGIKDLASGGDPIVLLLDTAYLEFAENPDQEREFLRHFQDLPPNVLITIAWSGSKAYTLYGLRLGAAMAVSPDAQVADDFKDSATFTARGTWSNSPRAGMSLLEQIQRVPALAAALENERAEMRATLAQRAQLLAESANLDRLPFSAGFFTVLRHEDPVSAAARLQAENMFVVPMHGGVRIALSSVPSAKIPPLAEALERVQRS